MSLEEALVVAVRQAVAEAVEPLRRELEQMRREKAEELVSLGEAARRMGVSPRTITRWIASGDLEVVMVGGTRRVRPKKM